MRVPGACYGVIRQQNEDAAELEYLAASEVTGTSALPDSMVQLDIPAATYATFPATPRSSTTRFFSRTRFVRRRWPR
jgi:predicted transcriptional regulator YdeE